MSGMSVNVLHRSPRDQFAAKVMISVSLMGASFAIPGEQPQDTLTCLMAPQRVRKYASACGLPSEASVTAEPVAQLARSNIVARSTSVIFPDSVIALHVGSTAIVISCLRGTVPRKVMLPAASKKQGFETAIIPSATACYFFTFLMVTQQDVDASGPCPKNT